MIKIELSSASNGVIKKVLDTNSKEDSSSFKVYEIESDPNLDSFLGIMEIFTDISADLGLDLGSDFDPYQLNFDINWGEKYIPTEEEVEKKIKSLNADLKKLRELKKLLNDGGNV
jgi:hypothetical protein